MKITSLLALLLSFTFVQAAWSLDVDVAQSRVLWAGHKIVGGHTGTIKVKSASLNWDNDKLTGGKIVMDLNDISVDELPADKQTRFLSHMKSADFFEVEKYPEASFEITEVTPETLKGKLNIKGKEILTEIPYKRTDNTVTGKFSFDRTQFGLVYNSSNFFKDLVADKVIKDNVDVSFEIHLK